MKETLISFETAKLAKKKGFGWFGFGECEKFYYPPTKELTRNHRGENYPAPTQSLLQKWLREVHEIHININTFYFEDLGKYGYEVEDIIHKEGWVVMSNTAGTYEEALEKGLQKALKLIKL